MPVIKITKGYVFSLAGLICHALFSSINGSLVQTRPHNHRNMQADILHGLFFHVYK